MKVVELIEVLSRFDGQLEVALLDSDFGDLNDFEVYIDYENGIPLRVCIE